jgi:hypothetical protein
MKKSITTVEQAILNDIAFDKAIEEFFKKELAKPQPVVCYLSSAQRLPESLVGPLSN